jgi:NitT/TauT family transport system ATP-binding protein
VSGDTSGVAPIPPASSTSEALAPAFLEARSVSKSFVDARRQPLRALQAISLNVGAGEFLAVVGPSGCGKSTLLRLLSGLEKPDSGEVRLRGELLSSPRREIGFVFQQSNLMPWRTVLRNISLPLEVAHLPREAAVSQAATWVSLVGLDEFRDSFPNQLSGGMRQRVALARALIQEPSLLLLDEPFGSLDALTRDRMNEELLRIWGLRRPAVVMVTHSISEAVLLADRVLVMSPRPGQIRAEFSVPFARPRNTALTGEPGFVRLARSIRAEIAD